MQSPSQNPERAEIEATQLQHADPAAWAVAAGWKPLVDDFFSGATGLKLTQYLQQRLDASAVIFPPQPLRALELTPPEEVRVVILGQDPYHGRGQAEGLAFSVASGVRLPPSLQNIFKEMQRDLGTPFPPFPNPGGSLVKWATHGVLLLNTCLSVEEGQAASHSGKGWEQLTPGTQTNLQYDRTVGDLVNYLQWMGEPAQQTRVRVGVWVLMFIALFILIAWRLNAAYWKDVK